jgi:hypothetical protein
LSIVAPASYAQARIWLDERIRFNADKPLVAIYNMPFLYRLSPQHTLTIKHLHHALQLTVIKHQSLRTSLIFDADKNVLMQQIVHLNDNKTKLFAFIETTFDTEEQLDEVMHEEERNSQLFDLVQGLVFRCHIVYHKKISSNDRLSDKDAIIFNFHHALFDFPSMDVFLHDLNQAYTTGHLTTDDDDTTLRYLDCKYIYIHYLFSKITMSFTFYLDAITEQQMPMIAASMFWSDALYNCNLDRPIPLPYDRYRLSDEHRTGHGTAFSFDFSQDLSHDFLAYALSNNMKPEHLAHAIYYLFLFKLTSGETDVCIRVNTDLRYHDELRSVIGLFENLIPLRCQLDPSWSFDELIKYVYEIVTSSMKYSYYPLQRILDQHPNVSKPAFLDISFAFQSNEPENKNNEVLIGDARLHAMPTSINNYKYKATHKCDFSLIIKHDLNMNQLSCIINASHDLFYEETINKISQRFHSILNQLFTPANDQTNKPIYELSLTIPDEKLLTTSINNTQVSFPTVTCIHQKYVHQTMKYPQKLAVELDDQCLTYSELLHHVQILSLNILNTYTVTPGEIICQCVERSLSMVSG